MKDVLYDIDAIMNEILARRAIPKDIPVQTVELNNEWIYDDSDNYEEFCDVHERDDEKWDLEMDKRLEQGRMAREINGAGRRYEA